MRGIFHVWIWTSRAERREEEEELVVGSAVAAVMLSAVKTTEIIAVKNNILRYGLLWCRKKTLHIS
jgi:hypothetical protein